MASTRPQPVVLVVDDERDMRLLLRVVLESAGFAVDTATNGAAALRRVKAELPAMVVTDLMMPVMGGRELISHLRADPALAGIGILVISASLSGQRTGADECIEKPFHPAEVIAAVARLTGHMRDDSSWTT